MSADYDSVVSDTALQDEDAGVEEVALSMALVPGVGRETEVIPDKKQRTVNYGIEQQSKLRGDSRRLYVFDGRYLAYQRKTEKQAKKRKPVSEHVVELAVLAADLKPRLQLAWGCCLLSLVCLVLSILCWVEPVAKIVPSNLPLWLLSLTSFILALAFAGLALLRSRWRVSVQTACGGVTLFELYRNLPDKQRFGKMMLRLEKDISAVRAKLVQDRYHMAREVEEHRRLAESGLITRNDYETAKQRIFAVLQKR